MRKYYLKVEWVDKEFEISEQEYRRTYMMHGIKSGAPTSVVPHQFKSGIIHAYAGPAVDDNEQLEIKWGLPEQLDPPTDAEKKHIMKLIDGKARKSRVFELNVTKAVYNWLKASLKNAYVHLIRAKMDTSSLNDHWIAIGINEETTKKWVSRI